MSIARSLFRQPVSGKRIPSVILLVAILPNVFMPVLAQPQPATEIIARSTDPVFGSDIDTEARLEIRAFINNEGDVAFGIDLVEIGGSSDFVTDMVFRYSGGVVIEEARLGVGGVGGTETVDDLFLAGLSNNGSTLIRADLLDDGTSDPVAAVFLGDNGTLTELLRQGDALPDGETLNRPLPPRINANDQVAFLTVPPSEFLPDAVILADADGIEPRALTGQDAAGQTDALYDFFTGFAPISDAGHVGFTAKLTGAGVTEFVDDKGFYVAAPDGIVTQYARTGAPAPTEPGSTIAAIGTRVPLISDGRALLSLFFRDAEGDFSTGGLFMADGSSLEPVLLGEAPAPGIDGQFIDFPGVPSLNDQGDIAVLGFLTDDIATGNRTGQAIFVGDSSSLAPIVQTGDPVPGGMGEFRFFGNGDDGEVALNEKGQIVFAASVDLLDGGDEFDTFGLFFYDPDLGLKTIVMRDQPFDGDTLANFIFLDNAGAVGDAASGLNDVDQVAFQYLLQNGETGIAVFTNRDDDLIFRDSFETSESNDAPAVRVSSAISESISRSRISLIRQQNTYGN